MKNHSYENEFDENEFDLNENETACRTHFVSKVLHLDSFCNRGTRKLGNGLCNKHGHLISFVRVLLAPLPS